MSTIDTHQTFLKYVGEDQLDGEFVEMIKMWQWEKWSLCVLHLAMSEPPRFKAAESHPDLDRAFIHVLGYESLADLKGHWDAMSNGRTAGAPGLQLLLPERP